MGGSGGAGFSASNFALGGRETGLNAALFWQRDAGGGDRTCSAGRMGWGRSVRCLLVRGPGATAVNRFDIADMPIPNQTTISATVVEGLGTLRHASYNVSVEQRQP